MTAYAGAAASLSPAVLPYAASILATEGCRIGAIRGQLAKVGRAATTNGISALRSKLSGVGDNGPNDQGNAFNFTNVDEQGQAYRRSPEQVLSIIYGGNSVAKGGFVPNGATGFYTTSC